MSLVDEDSGRGQLTPRAVAVFGAGKVEESLASKDFDGQVHRVRGADNVEAFGEHRPGVETVPFLAQRPSDREIDLAVFEQLGDLASGAAPNFQLKARKVAVHLGERPGQQLEIEGSRDGERQRRDLALLDLGGDLFGGDRAVIALLEQRLHAVAEIGQMAVAAFAPDKLTAELVLELLDRAGKRGL